MNPVEPTSVPPTPAARKRRPAIFIGMALVALALGIGATWLYSHRQNSREITVRVQDAYGLKVDAEVRYRGVAIGRVTEVHIPNDLGGVELRLKLHTAADLLARTGSQFYIVRPSVSLANGIRGMETAIGDVYVDVTREPGLAGEPATQFVGCEEPPIPAPIPGSREVKLTAKRSSHALRAGVPVSCCGFAIGRVMSVKLADDGQNVQAILSIDPKYAEWVNRNPKFLVPAPLKVEGSLLNNPKIHVDPSSLLGGIEMVVSAKGGSATDKTVFQLEE